MRTKTLLLSAALTAAGALTSMAQVYSVNIVGYINVSVPHGFSMLGNQLNATPNNQLATLVPNPPNGTFVYKFNNASGTYTIDDFADGAWEGDTSGAMTLNPGEGVFMFNPSTAYTLTLVGEVQLTSSTPVPHGFSIVSSALPQSAGLDALNYTAGNGDFTYQFVNASGTYKINDFADGAWEGDDGGNAPTPSVGEAFFLFNPNGSKSWNRTFVVGPP